MTLRQRTLRAGTSTVASYAVELSTKLLSNLIMTRLLFPDAFGVIAAAMALIVGIQLLTDFGVRIVIIQSPRGENVEFLRSAWIFQCFRGILLWLVIAVGCAILSLPSVRSMLATTSVFADPSFPAVVATLGLTLVLDGPLEIHRHPVERTKIEFSTRRLPGSDGANNSPSYHDRLGLRISECLVDRSGNAHR